MKNSLMLALVALATFVFTPSVTEAGPRDGGRRGAARPSAPTRNLNRTPPSGNLRQAAPNIDRTSRDLGSRDLSNRTPSNHNLSGQQRLSGILEGQNTKPTTRPASKQQLNDFLGLSGETKDRVNNRQPQWNQRPDNRQLNVNQTTNNISGRSGEIYNNVNVHLDGKPQPFTAAWYAQHPNAWQYQHPHADAWAAASFGALTGWVAGMATAPVVYNYNQTTAYVEGNDSQPTSSEAQTEEAQQLTQSSTPANADEDWLPVGVYALVQGNESTKAQMLMQISVSKSGQIGGSYYNVLSGNSQPLTGSLNKQTQKVAWTIAGNQKAVFQTDLQGLTQPETPVLVHYGQGETEQMTLVRMPDNT
ncbi:hypothetical protein [Blastopirellula marina]|uniref:Uncharacterized protein n=1 Tax=Blastopirellula marina TaxID=124 RepID=A0A2S8GCS4_9BACT|nr:hypothetical protein [Blastopirellula marina]PQO42229.1 hypothetical protein C5Y93_28190 [Blastopirellula marina]